jgi:hypothetical protein
MIKQIMNAQSFSDAMKDAGDYRDTFSDEGLKTLFEYLHKQDDILFDSQQIPILSNSQSSSLLKCSNNSPNPS